MDDFKVKWDDLVVQLPTTIQFISNDFMGGYSVTQSYYQLTGREGEEFYYGNYKEIRGKLRETVDESISSG